METFHPSMHRHCHWLGMSYVRLVETYRKLAQDDTDEYVAEAHAEWLTDCMLAGFDPSWRDYSRYIHKA